MSPSINIALLLGKSPQLQAVSELLARAAFRCNVFEAGRDLIHSVTQAPYDMLLIDDELPDIPAIDVVRAVRGALSRDVPIMMPPPTAVKTAWSTPSMPARMTTCAARSVRAC
ncbi:response regulator [Cupriavidus sp. DF5525]|uniref:response regulator n=1 Tax=Cupriavidus sp. DF5525 TaxID=3160989 RepID=UPI0003FEF299